MQNQKSKTRRLFLIGGAIAAVLLLAVATFAATNKVTPVGWGVFGPVNQTDGLGLQGYDVVSYQAGAPVKGTEEHTATHEGVTWRFATAANQASFTQDPARYLPRFGGFCSFAVSKGFTADTDPLVYHLDEGRLMVFDSEDVKADYLAAFADNRTASEANWAKR